MFLPWLASEILLGWHTQITTQQTRARQAGSKSIAPEQQRHTHRVQLLDPMKPSYVQSQRLSPHLASLVCCCLFLLLFGGGVELRCLVVPRSSTSKCNCSCGQFRWVKTRVTVESHI